MTLGLFHLPRASPEVPVECVAEGPRERTALHIAPTLQTPLGPKKVQTWAGSCLLSPEVKL